MKLCFQEYSAVTDDSEIVSVPFPFNDSSITHGNFRIFRYQIGILKKL